MKGKDFDKIAVDKFTCTYCRSMPGMKCKTPNGTIRKEPHIRRVVRAIHHFHYDNFVI